VALAAGVVHIPSDVSVEGQTIMLGQIATLDGLSPEEHAQVSRLGLGPAAAPAQHRTFSGQALREQLSSRVPDVVLDIADQIRVHTAYRDVGPDYLRDRLEQAIRQKMPWPASAVRFSGWRMPEVFAVPVRAQRLVVHFRPGEDFLGRINAQMELLNAADPESPRVRRTGAVQVDVRLPVVVTTRRLRRGETLDSNAIRLEERELRTLPRQVITDLAHAAGHRLKRNLAEHVALLPSHFESEPLVRRGDTVAIQAGGAGLDLRVEARALEHGALGQTIRVENPSSRRRFLAEITGPGSGRLPTPSVGSGP
jgi:flagella basal body P-ring formation protein FlgA